MNDGGAGCDMLFVGTDGMFIGDSSTILSIEQIELRGYSNTILFVEASDLSFAGPSATLQVIGGTGKVVAEGYSQRFGQIDMDGMSFMACTNFESFLQIQLGLTLNSEAMWGRGRGTVSARPCRGRTRRAFGIHGEAWAAQPDLVFARVKADKPQIAAATIGAFDPRD